MSDSRRVHSISLQIYVLFLFLQSIWPVFFTIFSSKLQIVFAKSISKSVEDAAPSDELFEREKTGSLCFDVDKVKSFQGKIDNFTSINLS